jgi:pilus assembly protein Flp/PilA
MLIRDMGPARVLKTTTRRPDMTFFNKLARDEQGATAIEYGLIAALIAVAAIVGMQALGGSLANTFNGVSGTLNANQPAAAA